MVDVLGFDVPLEGFAGGVSGGVIELIGWFVVLGILGGIGLYFLLDLRIYNKKIVVFENISGQGFQPAYKDRAKLIKLGKGGEELLFLKKKRVYRTAYGRKMGKNTYWFAIGQDGYWYNCILGDIDAKMGMLDIEPIDRDMRYMHVAINKNIEDRYRKVSFSDKYGSAIIGGITLIILLAGGWFLLTKMGEISSGIASAVEASAKLQEGSKAILSSLDNICSGSGVRSA